MKLKHSIFIIGWTLVLSSATSAQLSIDTGVQSGYSWNIFKNPDMLVEQGDTLGRTDLWKNSSYNELFLNMDYLKNWGKSRLKLSGDVETNIYHQQTSAQRNNYRAAISYRSNFARRKYFEIAPEFTRRQQDGVDQSDLVFSTRLSYLQFEVPLHLDFYMGERAWFRFEGKYRYREFDEFNNSQTSYNMYFLEGLYKKRWDGKSISTTLEFVGEASYRTQQSEEFGEGDIALDLSTRDFLRADAGGALSFSSINDRFEIEFPVTWTYFVDRPTNALNYTEFEFGVESTFSIHQSELNVGLDRSIRNFSNFTVQDGSLLEYGFWTASVDIKVPVSGKMFFELKGNYQLRDSNRARLTTSAYRSYETSYIQTGIRLEL